MRRARRAGWTGSVQRVTDPFRQGLDTFCNGTATGWIEEPTAGEITAVTARRETTSGLESSWESGQDCSNVAR
jgi:hypothetical protein